MYRSHADCTQITRKLLAEPMAVHALATTTCISCALMSFLLKTHVESAREQSQVGAGCVRA
eukprot:3959429-Pleurochrysis_carterae.AAC.1